MRPSKNVLLVTNTTSELELIQIKNALEEQKSAFDINLSLVHVIPSLPTCYFSIPSTVILAEQYYEEAQKCLSTIGELLGVTKKNQWLITGRVKTEVPRLANKLHAQFILASSHNLTELNKSIKVRSQCNAALIQNISAFVA